MPPISNDADQILLQRTAIRRCALGLGALAVLGLASLMAAPVEQLIPADLMPGDLTPLGVRVLAAIQPTMLTLAALELGLWLAPKVGLEAPFLSGELRFRLASPETRRVLGLAGVVALFAGIGLAAYDVGMARFGPEGIGAMSAFNPPLVTRVLYGGIVEEIISRWGAMTLIVWILARSLGQRERPTAHVFWVAALLAAFMFAVGHLPLLLALVADPPLALMGNVFGLNALVGTAFGWLYWRAGLEAAILAHAMTHIVSAATLMLVAMGGIA
jgi:membrane protease YdiL (CAAX protease family)